MSGRFNHSGGKLLRGTGTAAATTWSIAANGRTGLTHYFSRIAASSEAQPLHDR
jgi:hypothetical protein